MTADDDLPAGFSLKRWSRRKLEAARAAPASPRLPAAPQPASPAPSPITDATPVSAGQDPAPGAAPTPLPPVDSLHFDSDFTPFLQPKVDEAVKRQALKKLFQDPRFNVMDRLDVYIDDYSLPDPIAPDMVRQLLQAHSFFTAPKTRVNEQGFVEDVPADEPAAPPAASALPEPDVAAPPAPIPEAGAAAERSTAPDDGDPIHRRNEHPKQ